MSSNDSRLEGAEWFKSSRSNGQANCVEVAFLADGEIAMRDSKQHGNGPILTFRPSEWDAFLGGVADGEFNRPAN